MFGAGAASGAAGAAVAVLPASAAVGGVTVVSVVVVVVAVPLTCVVSEGFCWQAVTLTRQSPATVAAIMCLRIVVSF